MAKRKEIIGFSVRGARRIRNRAGGVQTRELDQSSKPRSGDKGKFFKLLEDVTGSGTTTVWAENSDEDETSLGGHVQVVSWGSGSIINGAKDGYHGLYIRVKGKWMFVQGGCVVPCPTDGSITGGTGTAGTVGESYPGHTIASSGLDGGLTVTGLPPGLSVDGSGNITGTPTEAGSFFVKVTGSAPKTGDGAVGNCTITRLIPITIVPAPESPPE